MLSFFFHRRRLDPFYQMIVSMAQCKTAITPLLMHWGYCSVALSHLYMPHYNDVIMGAIARQINSPAIVYSAVYSGVDQRKHQSSASLAFVWGIHRGPVNSPHKWPVTRKMFPFDDVIMCQVTVLTSPGNHDINVYRLGYASTA